MAYKDIVVHLAQDKRSQVRLEAAIELAERHEGRVTGVYVLPRLVVPGFASFELSTEVYKRLDTEQRAARRGGGAAIHSADGQDDGADRMAPADRRPSRWRHHERPLRRHHDRRPDRP